MTRQARQVSACLAFSFGAIAFVQDPIQRGLEALQRNDWAAARQALDPVSQSNPDDPRVWVLLARASQKLGLAAEAESAASRAAKFDTAYTRQGLAIYHAEGGRAEDAAEWADRASATLSSGEHASLRNFIGKVLASPVELKRAVELNPYEEAYRADLGRLLLARQRFAEAVAEMEASRKIFSASAQLELMLGVAHYGLRRFPDAVEAFLKVIQIDPTIEQPYIFLNRMLPQAIHRLPEVESAFAAFAARNPHSALGPFLKARAIIIQLPPSGMPLQVEVAEKLLRSSLAGDAANPDAHAELAYLLERKGDYASAERSLTKAAALRPSDAVFQYRLSRIYDRMDRAGDAAKARARHSELVEKERSSMDKHAVAPLR
jgi:tetratricopeptide (TPR) repeat protein